MRALLPLVVALLAAAKQAPLLYPEVPPPPQEVYPGHYVTRIEQCSKLDRRPIPRNARDLRPDDFTVIMALGDSVTAGFYAKSTSWLDMVEWRGVSYATGEDEDAISLASLMHHYSPRLQGGSHGQQGTVLGNLGGRPDPEVAGLNGAVSGAHASELPSQTDYLIEQYYNTSKADGWAFLNVMVGANDQCQYGCGHYLGDAVSYAEGVYTAIERVRAVVPRLLVNIIGNLKVSDIYEKTLLDPYCSPLPIPHISIECSCALTPGPVGDATRRAMDSLAEKYDTALKGLVSEWNGEEDPKFAVAYQPGSVFSLAAGPIEALSKVDCFHPSELGHHDIAAGIWNRLAFRQELKGVVTSWNGSEVHLRCLQDEDRIVIPHTL